MHTVSETHSFRRASAAAGMTPEEVDDLVNYIAEHPMAGDEMSGTGGCRKVRRAGKGKGKSGGYRVITFYTGDQIPVFLLTVFSKGERPTLTKREQNQLAAITRAIVEEYRTRVVKVGGER
jgi:hypothetical protein